jgi:hypothetical protein
MTLPLKSEPSPTRTEDAPYKSIYTWGVRDRAGEWVTVTDHQWFAPHLAKNITKTAALDVFARHPEAFQLVDGCDCWACLRGADELFVVVEEKNVVAREAVPRT